VKDKLILLGHKKFQQRTAQIDWAIGEQPLKDAFLWGIWLAYQGDMTH
jgi:hypothetical protein